MTVPWWREGIRLEEACNLLEIWSVPSGGVVEELLRREMSKFKIYGIPNFCNEKDPSVRSAIA